MVAIRERFDKKFAHDESDRGVRTPYVKGYKRGGEGRGGGAGEGGEEAQMRGRNTLHTSGENDRSSELTCNPREAGGKGSNRRGERGKQASHTMHTHVAGIYKETFRCEGEQARAREKSSAVQQRARGSTRI